MILFPTSLRKMFSLSNVIFPAVTFLHLKRKIKKLLSSSCSPWCVYFSSSSTEEELACLVWRITPPLMFMTLPLLSHAFLSQWLASLWSLPLHWYFILCLQIFSNTLSMHESKMILKKHPQGEWSFLSLNVSGDRHKWNRRCSWGFEQQRVCDRG